MQIVEVIAVPVRGGFFADDQAAIREGAVHAGFGYVGSPVTPGFGRIRQPAEALSILLVLDDGSVAHGDCAAVQYPGVGGRDAVFDADHGRRVVERAIAPVLRGREVTTFRSLATELEAVHDGEVPVAAAIHYGVSQAILGAVALARRMTMAEVIRDEYGTGVRLAPVPLYAQTGDDRYLNAEKMILHGVDVLPHGLINSVDEKLGSNGELLAEYLAWLVRRIVELAPRDDYHPRIHTDTYGTIGLAFRDADGGPDVAAVARYLRQLGEICAPYSLTVEQPIDGGSRDGQVAVCRELRAALAADGPPLRGAPVRIAVDEWCNTLDDIRLFVSDGAADVIHIKAPDLGGVQNTIEALLLVRAAGLDAFCGGSSTETDRSAVVSAHIAMACGASQVLAKPGMGVDEGLMIVGNEMARTVALAESRQKLAESRQKTETPG